MASIVYENNPRQQPSRMSLPTACEACRKQKVRSYKIQLPYAKSRQLTALNFQKMRCTRQLEGADDPSQPCDRCRRNNRECRIPQKQPLGRKPGALGRYRGVEKAVRQIQTHIRKTALRSSEQGPVTPSQSTDVDVLSLLPAMSPRSPQPRQEGGGRPPTWHLLLSYFYFFQLTPGLECRVSPPYRPLRQQSAGTDGQCVRRGSGERGR